MMDPTDYADMLIYLNDFAESLESESSEAAHKARLLLRRAEAMLRPLTEASEDAGGLCIRCQGYPISNQGDRLCSRCDENCNGRPDPDYIDTDEARRINSFEMWGHLR